MRRAPADKTEALRLLSCAGTTRDVAVLTIDAASPTELRARCAPNRRGRPGLDALEASRGFGNAVLLPVLFATACYWRVVILPDRLSSAGAWPDVRLIRFDHADEHCDQGPTFRGLEDGQDAVLRCQRFGQWSIVQCLSRRRQSSPGFRAIRRLFPYVYGTIVCMKKTLHIDEHLLREAKSVTGAKTDTETVRLGLEALIRRRAYERLRALRGSEPHAREIPRRRERASSAKPSIA